MAYVSRSSPLCDVAALWSDLPLVRRSCASCLLAGFRTSRGDPVSVSPIWPPVDPSGTLSSLRESFLS